MPDCECINACPFFNDKMASMSAIADMMKRKYCQGDNSACARYMVRRTLGKEKVPTDLFPNQVDRARQMVGAG